VFPSNAATPIAPPLNAVIVPKKFPSLVLPHPAGSAPDNAAFLASATLTYAYAKVATTILPVL
jgi:predicted dienelactone hydrolase